MKTYVTFGSGHAHEINGTTFDVSCVAVITSPNSETGRALAFELFGNKFCFEYPEDHFDFGSMHYYPRGFIEIDELTLAAGKGFSG